MSSTGRLKSVEPADESNAGRTLLRCIDRLLQEGREMEIGVMVVDQSPVRPRPQRDL